MSLEGLRTELFAAALLGAAVLLWFIRRIVREQSLGLADAASYARIGFRTRAVQAVLVAALFGSVVFAYGSVWKPVGNDTQHFLPAETSGVIVIDLSGSIFQNKDKQVQIGEALEEIVFPQEGERRFGLVLFADLGDAYLLWPPGTASSEFKPLMRFFTPESQAGRQTRRFSFPDNPWRRSFTGGTTIFWPLRLARQALEQGGYTTGTIVLMSDLDGDFRTDHREALLGELRAIRESPYEMRVVALSPSPRDQYLFQRMLGDSAFIIDIETFLDAAAPQALPGVRTTASKALIAAIAALAAFLGMQGWWGTALAWRRLSLTRRGKKRRAAKRRSRSHETRKE